MFQISIHWMQFTITEETSVNETVEEIGYYLGSKFEDLGHGALGYENMVIGVGGSRILTSAKRPEHHVILPGEWCQAVGSIKCSVVLAWVLENKGKFTRVDLAGDDYDKSVSVKDVAASCEKGELVSHCHAVSRIYGLRGKPQDGIYIGSANSRRRLRIYDKEKESEGEIDAIRWELQLRDEAANQAALMVLSKSYQEAYTSILVGIADFREMSKKNTKRCSRLPWFRNLVGEAQKASLALPQSVKTIEKMELWLRRQVAPSLAAVTLASGGDLGVVEELIRDGQKRFNPAHRMAIEEAIRARS